MAHRPLHLVRESALIKSSHHLVALAVIAGLSLFASAPLSAPLVASTLAESNSALPAARSADAAPSLAPTGRLVFAAERNGTWNLFTTDAVTSEARSTSSASSESSAGAAGSARSSQGAQPLAINAAPARDPAISPDGKTIAFRSHRDGFWDIYTAPLNGGVATRLTRNMVYSGAPVWSPDGKKIAFESYAHGDLDIWVMNADGTQAIDLTDDSRYPDYGPAWSPDGQWIAFTSWRTGTQQIFIVPSDCMGCKRVYNYSQNRFDDQEPTWSPDGKQLAFVSTRDNQRAIYIADFAIAGVPNARRLTYSGWDDQPAWSPDGKWIAFVSVRPTRQPVYVVPATGGMPRLVENTPDFAVSVVWAPDAVQTGELGEGSAPYSSYPDVAAPNSGHPYEMRRMTSTRLDPGINKLNGRVADAFVALQERVKQEVGYDFLSVLADMARPVDYRCDITCDTLSWHKAGRAFDSRLDYNDGRGSALEITREDQQGWTFWRLFLRTSAQDGSMGEPMKEAPWDLGYRARWIVGRGEGGVEKPVPPGFYVDFTELAREYDWVRISSHDGEGFDWRTNKIAAEYWHYETRQGLNWYQAMREVFSQSDLKSITDWETLITREGYDPYLLDLKGIPAPPGAWRWNVLGP